MRPAATITVSTCLVFSSSKVDVHGVIKWTVVGATVDRWFITEIVKHCLQHDSVARVHYRQPMPLLT